MNERRDSSGNARWVGSLFLAGGLAAIILVDLGVPGTLLPAIVGLTIGTVVLAWSARWMLLRPERGDPSRFGENGAVLDRMSDEMRAEYENPTYGSWRVDPRAQREGLIVNGTVGAITLLGAWLMPLGYEMPLAAFMAVIAVMLLCGLDILRTWKRRRDNPQRALPWADKDSLSKFAAVCAVFAFGVIYANVLNGIIFENLSIASPVQ